MSNIYIQEPPTNGKVRASRLDTPIESSVIRCGEEGQVSEILELEDQKNCRLYPACGQCCIYIVYIGTSQHIFEKVVEQLLYSLVLWPLNFLDLTCVSAF